MKKFDPAKYLILLVDDEISNIEILDHLLSAQGYRIKTITEAEHLLTSLPELQPDLVLLDVTMPYISGYTLCQKIKDHPEHRHLPVIFLTARDKIADVIKGFEVGGADYITKPFAPAELLARVKNHLLIRQQQQDLITLNEEKNHFLTVASHDVRSPLANIVTIGQLLERSKDDYDADTRRMHQLMVSSAERCLNIVNDLLDVHRIEAGRSEPRIENVDLRELLQDFQTLYRSTAHSKRLSLQLTVPDSPCIIRSDSEMLSQIVDNLLSNALKYSPVNTEVSMTLTPNAPLDSADLTHYTLTIQDEGPGFTPEDRQKMYQPFTRLTARPTGEEASTGLGLSIVKEYCDQLHIDIELKDTPKGARFELTLKTGRR